MTYRSKVAVVYLLGFFLDLINMFIASVAFPAMAHAFNTTPSALSWVSNGYIAGLTLVILSGARVLDPFFEGLGENGEMIQLAVEVACFVIGAELLLKPAFEDQKEIGTKKNITPRGSGDSFSAKANKKESTKKTKKNNNQIKRSYSTGNKKYRKK